MFSEIEVYIYEHLIDGIPQIKIVKRLYKKLYGEQNIERDAENKISKRLRQQVSYYTRKMERNGLVKPVTKNQYVKIYRATSFTPGLSENVTPINSDKLQKDCKPANEIKVDKEIDVHSLSYQFFVEEKPRRDIKWDDVNTEYNGVTQKYIKVGRATIRYDENKHCPDKVYIWIPGKNIPPGQIGNCEAILQEYMWQASAWLQRVLLCRLGLPQKFGKIHYETDAREAFLREFAENNTIKVGDLWLDSSPPSRKPKVESDKLRKVISYLQIPNLDIPERVLNLERHLESDYGAIEKLAVGQEKLMEGQNKLVEENLKFMKKIEEFMGFRRKMEKRLEAESQVRIYG